MSVANPPLRAADLKRDLNENHSLDISLIMYLGLSAA